MRMERMPVIGIFRETLRQCGMRWIQTERQRKMNKYYETKVRYDKVQENGSTKKTTETYLVSSMTCTEAETIVVEEIGRYISGEYCVKSIKESKISEVVRADGQSGYWLACPAFVTLDERTGTEKRSSVNILVCADTFDAALDSFREHMKDTMSDWELSSLSASPIVEVIEKENA